MSHEVSSVVPVIYVTDVERSERFYALLGFTVSGSGSGSDDAWRWSFLQCGERSLLLASDGTAPGPDPGPASLYVSVTDLQSVGRALAEVGITLEVIGYPDHAPGGEARISDPDGHGILLGQPTGVPPAAADGDDGRRGTLKAAAAAMQQRGVEAHLCQVGTTAGGSCDRPAEVKLADSWGDTLWSCMAHADEVLINARGAFIATEDGQGLGQYLRLRRNVG